MSLNYSEIFQKVISTTMDDITMGQFLFFDIETVPMYSHIDSMPKLEYSAWHSVASRKHKDMFDKGLSENEIYQQNAGLLPEYNKVVCISVGRFIEGKRYTASLFTMPDHSESIIIKEFCKLLSKSTYQLVGFNIVGFDIPVLFKKCIKYDIPIPQQLSLHNTKPWERTLVDIYEIWKNGSHSSTASLQTVSTFLNCGNPKNVGNGTDVKKYYRDDHDYKRITTYCEADVDATMCIFSKLHNSGII